MSPPEVTPRGDGLQSLTKAHPSVEDKVDELVMALSIADRAAVLIVGDPRRSIRGQLLPGERPAVDSFELRLDRAQFQAKKVRPKGTRGVNGAKVARLPPTGRGAASHCDDDLADLLVGFQKAVRLGDLLQRERPGDHRLQVCLRETLEDQFVIAGEALRVVPDLRG